MTVNDKIAHYCSKNIFPDEASQLENNNHDNGLLLCSVTPLKCLKNRKKKKKSCTKCDSASFLLHPTACPLAAD